MANIPLKSIKFPDLADTYTVPSNAGELPYNKSATYPDDTVGKALQNIGDSVAPAIIETATGSIASFTDGANVPVKDLLVDIEPVQSGSGDPSPDNVRAISGWTGATIEVADINIWDENRIAGGINGSGANTETAGYYRSDYIVILPNTTYYLKTPINMNVYYYDATKTFISSDGGNNKTFTTPPNAKYLRFRNSTQNEWNSYGNNVSLNYPSTDHDYHAYSGEVHTISFASAGTVYGGTLDVTSGVLTVDRKVIDLGEYNYTYYSTYATPIFGVSLSTVGGKSNGECQAEKYKYQPAFWVSSGNDFCIASGNSSLNISNSNYTDADAFKTAMSGSKVVLQLPTPQTYQLTPTEVKTLLKNNNIWADTGDVTVEYVADTKTFIENLVNA